MRHGPSHSWPCWVARKLPAACSEVCPEAIDPAGALQQVKVASTIDRFKEHLLPGGGPQ